MANNRAPAFFKFIVAPDRSERLRIPMAFTAYMKGMLPRNAFLRNPYGDIWPVAIARNESTGECTFESGWREFAEQNKLEYQDILIFQYDGGELIDFKLYGKSNAEKDYMKFPTVISEPEEEEQKRSQETGLQLALPQEMEPEHEADAEPVEPVERECMAFQQVKLEPEAVEQQQLQEMGVELAKREEVEPELAQREEVEPEREPEAEAEPDLEPAEKEYLRFSSVRSEPWELEEQQQPHELEVQLVEPLRMEPEPELEHEAEPEREAEPELEYSFMEVEDHDEADSDFLLETEEENSSRSMKIRRKRAPAIKEADENALFESGNIPRPTNPFFVSQRRSDRNELYVPTDVIRDFAIKLPKDLSVFDEKNREWVAKVQIWKDGRIWLSKGWKSFCKWNYVKPTDMCVCEFIPATDEHDVFLKVRVIRDGALTRPARSS